MNTDQSSFRGKHSDLSGKILKAYYAVYNELGSGFLESVYHAAMASALSDAGVQHVSQASIPVFFRGRMIADFRADLLVEDKILLELKAVQALAVTHQVQLLNYLKATRIEVGLLLNFGSKPEYKRLLLDNEEKRIRVDPCESVVDLKESQ